MARARTVSSFAVAASALLATGNTSAQNSAQAILEIEAEKEPEPVDRLANMAEVSAARIVVGVSVPPIAGFGNDGADRPRLFAGIPDSWRGGPVCARLISSDALYEARAQFDVSSDYNNNFVVLKLPIAEENWKALKERGPERLAVAVTNGTCNELSGEFVVAGLSSEEPQAAELLLVYVNSQGASRVFASVTVDGQSSAERVSCEQPPEGGSTGYDRICSISAELAVGKSMTVVINRVSFGAFETPVELIINSVPALDGQ